MARKILSVLKETFPNIQFIITTHSPIILSEVDENFNLFFMKNDNGKISVEKIKQLSGYDANAVLEQFMGTKSINARTESLIHSIYVDIEKKNYDSAIAHINKIIGNDKRKSSGCYHVPNGVKKEDAVMIYIQKGDEPDFLLDFKKSYPQKTYDSDEFSKFRIPLKED